MFGTVALLVGLTCLRVGVSLAERRGEQPNARLRTLGEVLESLIAAVTLVFLVIRPFVCQTFYIPSESMLPTLATNDRILVNKLAYRLGKPARYEVVVFHAPKAAAEPSAEGEDQEFIKRIIALPGETVQVYDGHTYVNGKRLTEPFIAEDPTYWLPPTVVPKGCYYVMGDNRNHSNDSHRWGPVDGNRLVGRAIGIFWPLGRLGGL